MIAIASGRCESDPMACDSAAGNSVEDFPASIGIANEKKREARRLPVESRQVGLATESRLKRRSPQQDCSLRLFHPRSTPGAKSPERNRPGLRKSRGETP
jgi:hypothetical protein